MKSLEPEEGVYGYNSSLPFIEHSYWNYLLGSGQLKGVEEDHVFYRGISSLYSFIMTIRELELELIKVRNLNLVELGDARGRVDNNDNSPLWVMRGDLIRGYKGCILHIKGFYGKCEEKGINYRIDGVVFDEKLDLVIEDGESEIK